MSAATQRLTEEVVQVLQTMMAREVTGSLTLHLNRGIVQKIERKEYHTVSVVAK